MSPRLGLGWLALDKGALYGAGGAGGKRLSAPHECALSLLVCRREHLASRTRLLGFMARCEGEGEGEQAAHRPSQEALGVDRACGNDFIGKACDAFPLLRVVLGGGWRWDGSVGLSVAWPARGQQLLEQPGPTALDPCPDPHAFLPGLCHFEPTWAGGRGQAGRPAYILPIRNSHAGCLCPSSLRAPRLTMTHSAPFLPAGVSTLALPPTPTVLLGLLVWLRGALRSLQSAGLSAP